MKGNPDRKLPATWTDCVNDADLADVTFSTVQVDADENKDWVQKYTQSVNVSGFPTVLFYKDGELVKDKRCVGYRPTKDFKVMVQQALIVVA